MDRATEMARFRQSCVKRLGEYLGGQFAALAKVGFELKPADDGRPATGRCRLGGRALLEPETSWPYYDDAIPLRLFAVLDIDVLAPQLGDELPCRPGLLNFFYYYGDEPPGYEGYLDLGAPGMCRVVSADPTRAVEVAGPVQNFAPIPLDANPSLALPCPHINNSESLEEMIERLDLDPGTELGELCDPEESVDWVFAEEYPLENYPALGSDDQAFGWPIEEMGPLLPELEGEHAHLLRLSSNLAEWEFAEGGAIHFRIPAKAFIEGDFAQAVVRSDCP